ncbi:SAM-dependent methyltransferase [Amorphus orientalis]|uniref:Cyclopropane-fatty-acyl-phospholipid synthase n=1 Tax=Amorphus orientalis TaxID=649198 RepID=A0AAE3VPB7_9HYPH|nr:cyclopropane-fatty-acyl-phospholipid synthase family protein [Amorphus orientalis]MDQ0316329.1 cyclopropane-fatty-acyl-phospholipid synthase [Amorphus orientalis]
MTIAMSEPILLNQVNLATALRNIPLVAKRGFALALKLQKGSLTVTVPDGRTFQVRAGEPGPAAECTIHDWRFVRRLLQSGDIGVAEAFMAGEWSSPDPTEFLELFAANRAAVGRALAGHPLARAALSVRHWLNRNTRSGAKRNIAAHYDLGNAFYEAWLDPSMTYSSAYYGAGANDLESAQRDKYRELARRTGLSPDHHVLEVGCGWGGFAEYAAREIGCRVTAITISQAQHDYATRRIADAGLSDKVSVQLTDYRDLDGKFDRIVSIEMFEAVGESYWPGYFRMLHDRLREGGKAGLQIITIEDESFDTYRRGPDFIQRYIFPGGMLPPPSGVAKLGSESGLSLAHEIGFGRDYARTLAEWRGRFREAWPRLVSLGFDERFRRMWEFYLHYCEAGFRAGSIDVKQFVFARP